MREFRSEILGGVCGSIGKVDQALDGFAPRGFVAGFDFAHALDDGLPEVSDDGEGPGRHDALVEHFPDDGEFDESPRAAGAGDVA